MRVAGLSRNTMRNIGATAALTLSLSALAACGGGSGASEETYKIGQLASLSGTLAQPGQHQRDGARSAVKAINAAGGVNGRKLELVSIDDGGTPPAAVAGFNKLNRDKDIIAIVGSTWGSSTLAFKPLLEKSKMPVLAPNATYEVTNPTSPWLFRAAFSAQTEVNAAIEMATKLGFKRAAILHTTDAYGAQGAKLLQDDGSIDITAVEQMEVASTDLTTQLTKIKDSKPDLLFLFGATPTTGLAVKNAGQLGLDLPIISNSAGATEGNLKAAKGSSELERWINTGIIDAENPLPRQEEGVKNLTKDYPSYAPDTYSSSGYAAVTLIAAALKEAGDDADRESLRDALEGLSDVPTTSGTYSFSSDDHDGTTPEAIVWLAPDGDRFRRVDDPASILKP